MRRYLLVLTTFAILLTMRAHAAFVSEIETVYNDSALVIIITTRGDTFQGVMLKTTKNACIFTINSKRKRIHKSKIQEIIYPGAQTILVHDDYKKTSY